MAMADRAGAGAAGGARTTTLPDWSASGQSWQSVLPPSASTLATHASAAAAARSGAMVVE
jgi:hypothetical protein